MVRNVPNNADTITTNNNNSNSSNPKVEKGYEALIKPMQDVIAKDWKLKLCNYLDLYIEYLHKPETTHINFTEAALLLQNTSNYYCRRVDLMYNWVRQFCITLAEKFMEYGNEEPGPSQKEGQTEPKPKKKPKKSKNRLVSDELELMNIFSTEKRRINLTVRMFKTTFGQVLLNSCVKTQTKSNTCIPVLQSLVEDMGYKHDYRLHWKIAGDGLLIEDFRYEPNNQEPDGGLPSLWHLSLVPICVLSATGGLNSLALWDCLMSANHLPFMAAYHYPKLLCQVENDIVINIISTEIIEPVPVPVPLEDAGDLGMDMDEHDGLDVLPVPPPNPELSGSVHLPDGDLPNHSASERFEILLDDLPVDVVTEAAQAAPKKPAENFFTVKPFASLILHRKFKKAQLFKLPKELIDDVNEMRRKRKKPCKSDDENSLEADYNYHLSFSQILGGKSEDMLQHQLSKKKATCMSRRRTRSQQKQSQENNNVENAAADINNDFFEDDNQNFEDLVNDMADKLPNTDGSLENQPQSNTAYDASAKLIDEIFKAKNDPLSISKRVDAWHQMIRPVLAKAEARSVFSVIEYGTRILDAFNEEGEVRPFSAIVAGQPKEEICRYFLSTLMLANTYNLEIRKTSDERLAKDCLEMKLLTKVRHHDELDANVGATTANGSAS